MYQCNKASYRDADGCRVYIVRNDEWDRAWGYCYGGYDRKDDTVVERVDQPTKAPGEGTA